MNRNGNIGKFTAFALAAILFLSGCNEQVTTPLNSETSSSTASETTTSTTSPIAAPDAVTGTYNGKTVTMKYVVQTDISIDIGFCRPFQNGFAIVNISARNGGSFAYVNKDGKMLGNSAYAFCYPFDSNGRALVEKSNKTWVYIDTTGKEVGSATAPEETDLSMYYIEGDFFGLQDKNGNHLTKAIYEIRGGFNNDLAFVVLTEGEHKNVLIDRQGNIKVVLPDDCKHATVSGDFIRCTYEGNGDDTGARFQLSDMSGKPLNELRFKAVGSFNEGLAPVMLDGKLGLMDEKGVLVIAPSLSLDNNYQVDLGIGENRIVVSYKGKMAIVEISLS